MLLLSLLALLITGSDAFVNSAVVVAVSSRLRVGGIPMDRTRLFLVGVESTYLTNHTYALL